MALTGLDRESAHPLQLHAVKWSWCTAANPGATGWLSPWVGMTTCFWFEKKNIQGWGGKQKCFCSPPQPRIFFKPKTGCYAYSRGYPTCCHGFAASQQLRFTVWSCNGWTDSLSNPVKYSLLTELLDDNYSVLVEMQLWQSNAWNYCMWHCLHGF